MATVLGAAATPAIGRDPKRPAAIDVIVIGAGLAGLQAALDLEAGGARVQVLEARARAGGRIWSLSDLPGNQEAGGTGIVSGYRRFVGRARAAGLALLPATGLSDFGTAETAIHWRGATMAASAWPGYASNPLPPAMRARLPWQIGLQAIAAKNPLSRPEDWVSPDFAQYDVSVATVLQAAGFDAEMLRMGFGINPGYADAHRWSALMAYQVLSVMGAVITAGAEPLQVEAGNQAVAEAMAAALKTPLRKGCQVEGINVSASGVTIRLASGEELRAGHVVAAVPLPALQQIAIDPAPPPLLQAAIASVAYNRATKVFLQPTRPFWHDDGLPPSMWTDGLAGRLIAMRDRAGGEIVTLMAFVTGPAAERLDRLAPNARGPAVVAAVEAMRPAARGALRATHVASWGQDGLAGGAYACWAPGQVRDFATRLGQPLGRLHFAGEHLALQTRGIEGAMESGERTAAAILSGRGAAV